MLAWLLGHLKKITINVLGGSGSAKIDPLQLDLEDKAAPLEKD